MLLIIVVLLIILGVMTALLINFELWRFNKIKRLEKESTILKTPLGSVECWMKGGEGLAIVMVHGSPGGYDQGKLISDLACNGFKVLSFSRPGYLRTPLKQKLIEEQADLLNALLNELGVIQAVIVGYSGGGPIAVSFANKHPEKTKGLLLEASLSREYSPPEKVKGTLLERIFLKTWFQDFISYLMILSLKIVPELVLRSMLKVESNMNDYEIRKFINHVKKHSESMELFRKLLDSTTPLSIRNPGLKNDLFQYKNLSPIDCSKIKCPVLIIHSPQDNDAKFKHAEHLINSIPHAEVLKVFGGHLMWMGPDAYKIKNSRLNFLNNLT